MIYLDLLIGFLKVGLFSFGGAYAAIPLIRDVVLSYGWIDEDTLANMIAVAESTPGPIMVNLATYIGCTKGGVLGGVLATFVVVLPAFFIILLIMVVLKKLLDYKVTQAILRGLKSCVIGIILATGVHMIIKTSVFPAFAEPREILPVIITAGFLLVYYGSRKVCKKKMSPIGLIVFSAIVGVAVYGL